MPKTEPDLRPLVESLSQDEQARLPGRLRALVSSATTAAWATAKAARDEAIAAARDPETGAIDVDAVAAVKDAWAKSKAELRAEG